MPRKTYVWLPRYSTIDIFTDDELEDVVKLARDRVLNAFSRATTLYRGKRHGTDNYISGIGSRQKHLVAYVVRSNMKPFVSIESLPELPPQLFGLSERQYAELIRQLHEYAMQLAVNSLHEQHLIWHDDHGLWNVCQSAMDAWRESDRRVRRAIKYDRRNYHGKIRSQSKRRGIPAGAANSAVYTNQS